MGARYVEVVRGRKEPRRSNAVDYRPADGNGSHSTGKVDYDEGSKRIRLSCDE